MTGHLHLIVSSDAFELIRGSDALTTYAFNTQVARHRFCRNCGIKAFYTPRSHPEGISVNLRCLDGASIDDFFIREFDGARWEANIDSIRG